ncbi:MAG: M24 family metallopeptidase, partial [Actinomyces dentalis]
MGVHDPGPGSCGHRRLAPGAAPVGPQRAERRRVRAGAPRPAPRPSAGGATARPWHFLGDVSAACGDWAHANGYSVVTALGGHGVGKDFHMEPFVPHEGEAGTGMLMVPGMVFT